MNDTTNSDEEADIRRMLHGTQQNTTQRNTTTYNSVCDSHSNLPKESDVEDAELNRLDRQINKMTKDADSSYSSYMGESEKDRREVKIKGRVKILKQKKHKILVRKKLEKQIRDSMPPKTEKVMNFSFTPEKIMALMSSNRLKNLGEHWDEEGLNLVEFVQMMIQNITTEDDDERYELIHGCYKLFAQVDINGDGQMEWGEFMQYIIDAVQGNSISGEDENETVQEQIARIKAKKYHRFQFAMKPIDKTNHQNAIAKAVHLGNTILCFERFQPSIKIYDFQMNLIKQTKMDVQQQNAFVTSITYCEDQKIYGVACSDSYLHFWVQGKIKIEPFKMIKAPCIQTKIWYMPNQKVWLTAGRDNKLRHWNISKNNLDPLLQTLPVHTDEITDCVEIYSPQCIATCSLDRTICMVSLENPNQKRIIQENHDTGIRHLRYQVTNGAQMVSIGNEIYANVWAPESLVSDIHIGKLRGHKKGIVDGSFLNRAPYFVTIDEENVIFFWDMITLINVQTIITPQKFLCEGMIALSNEIFWAYGRRFFQYDALQFEDDDAGVKNEEDYPLFAQFNYYTLSIFVVKKSEVRIYNVDKGQLFSLHSNVFKEEIVKAEISKFKIDKRHRKAYVSNNKGEIFVINCQNGIVCKNVTQYLEDRKNMKNSKVIQSHESIESLGSSNYGSDSEDGRNMLMGDDPQPKKKKGKNRKASVSSDEEDEQAQKNLSSPEIVDMHLVWEENLIMMLCCNAKEYIVYDESDTDRSQILRRISGAHKEEITIMAYDYHLSLVATGCINGEIAIYDFEMSKVEGLLLGHSGDITALEFFAPYPLLISASMDCHVCIWGVRPIAEKYVNICIKRFINFSWNSQTQKDVPCIVSRLMVWENENSNGIKKYRRLKGQQLPAITFRKFEHNFAFSFKEDFDAFYDEVFPQKTHTYINYSQEYKVDKLIVTDEYKQLLRDEKSAFFVTQAQSVGTDYNEKINERLYRAYLYVGDEFGFIKIWDLASFIKNHGISKISSKVKEKGQAYNPRRQEVINCSAFTNQNRKFYKLKPQKLPQAVDPSMTGVLIRETLGHQGVITSLSKIELHDAKMLLSSSKDCKVRVWSMDLDMYGNINGKTEKDDPKWLFPSSQKIINQMKEVEQVEEVMDNLELGLNEPRLPLIVDESRREKKKVERPQTRANWLLMQEEKMKKEQELDKKTKDMIKQNQRKIERENMIMNNMDRFVQQQEIQLSMLDLTKNNYLGPTKKLNKDLEKKHKEIKERDDRIIENLSDTKTSRSPRKKTTMVKRGFSSRSNNEQTSNKNMNQSGFKNVSMQRDVVEDTKNNNNKEILDKTKKSNQSRENISPQLTQRGSSFHVPKPKTTRTIKHVESKFDISNQDKSLIKDFSKVPKLRYALDSLKRKDRFATIDKEDGLEHYLQSQKFKMKSSIVRGIRNKRKSGRPISIADSEIQQFSEMGQDFLTLSRDISKDSIQRINEMSHVNIKRKHNHSMVVQPILHIVDTNYNSVERGQESQRRGIRGAQDEKPPISILQKGKYIASALDQEISRNEGTRTNLNGQIPTISLKDLKITLPDGAQQGTSPNQKLQRHPLALKFQSLHRQDDGFMTSTRDETSLISTKVQMQHLISPKYNASQMLELPPIKTNQQSSMTIQENSPSKMKRPSYLQSHRHMLRNNLNQSKTLQSAMLALQSQRSLQQSTISQKYMKKNEKFASLMEKYCGEKPVLAEVNRSQREKLEQQKQEAKKIHKLQKMGDRNAKKPDLIDLSNELKFNASMLEKLAMKLELKDKGNRKKIQEALSQGLLDKKIKTVAETIIRQRREAKLTRNFGQQLQDLSEKIEEGATTQIQVVSQKVNSCVPQIKKAIKSMELKKAMNAIDKEGVGSSIEEFQTVFKDLEISTGNSDLFSGRISIKQDELNALIQEVQRE